MRLGREDPSHGRPVHNRFKHVVPPLRVNALALDLLPLETGDREVAVRTPWPWRG